MPINLNKVDARRKITFLDLPPELRNDIYALALTAPEPIKIATTYPHVLEPALTLTSTQIRNESLSIFYSTNTFESPFATDIDEFLQLRNRRRQLKMLTSVRCGSSYSYFWAGRYLEGKLVRYGRKGLGKDVVAVKLVVEDVGVVWATREMLGMYCATTGCGKREMILPREGNGMGWIALGEGS